MIVQKEWMTTDDLAERLALSPKTVRRLTDAGKMPQPKRFGRAVRYQMAEIEHWEQQGCKPPVVRSSKRRVK